ncbi:MAG TPA: thiamine phosphate synthase [Candidatus Dormibacteraeota bacterium]|nr:thiamine phosphate synthase [Candidatus Dormibacteraeota bacterium]
MSQAWVRPARSEAGLARRAQLRSARLYFVTDDETPAAELPLLISRAVAGGVDLVQLRRKRVGAGDLRELARACLQAAHSGGALFLVDDHVGMAVEIGADGVHLGQTDLDPVEARTQLGPEPLLGLSTHNKAQVLKAAGQPVDYLSAGPVHATPTKPGRPAVGFEQVTLAAARATVPVVAIGGLGPGTARRAVAAGADIVCVVRAICQAEAPDRMAAELRHEMKEAMPWIRIRVNGEARKCPAGRSIRDFLDLIEVGRDGVVVERNGEIFRASELEEAALVDGDDLEVVHLVGGGSDHG